MLIGGLQKVSMLDFPGKIAAVVFTQGCPFRCRFCHNPELVLPERFQTPMKEADLWAFLEKRKGMLDGVVISGGEPTLQPDLAAFIQKLKALDYAVKLDSNGAFPERLEKLFAAGGIDYVAMDLKAGWGSYAAVAGVAIDEAKIRRSMELIRASGIPYEWRTTVVPELPIDTSEVAKLVRRGERLFLQHFRASENVLDPTLKKIGDPKDDEALLTPLLKAGMDAVWR
jgi:pyruvate formate lyase activating enzyme